MFFSSETRVPKGAAVRDTVEIENIEQLWREQGIDDVELRQEIRGLRKGDLVRLTLLNAARPCAGETLLVRITSIRGAVYRGKLAGKPLSPALANVRPGVLLAFTADHIHSLPRGSLHHAH